MELTLEQQKAFCGFRCHYKALFANERFRKQIKPAQVLIVLEKYNFKCFYCDQDLEFKNWELDHYISRINGVENVIANLRPACPTCNTMKGALNGLEFIEKCCNIADNEKIVT